MEWLSDLFKSRRQKMQEFAYALEMEFYETPDAKTRDYLDNFKSLRMGTSRRIKHLLHQHRPDMDIHIFDFYADVNGDGNRKLHSMCWIESPALHLPHMLLRPEHFGHAIMRTLGQKDINFPEYPAFSKKYWLRGISESEIRYLMNDELLQYFSMNSGWYWECFQHSFILFKKNSSKASDRPDLLYEAGETIFNLLQNRGMGRFV